MVDLSKINIMIGTPCYGGTVSCRYMLSLINLITIFRELKVKYTIHSIPNESLITRARNSIVARFIGQKEQTHLMFIDADIEFNANSVIRMLLFDKDIVGGAYPKKVLDFNSVKQNVIKDNNISPEELLQKSLNYVLNIKSESNMKDTRANIENGFVKVTNIGTGFMLIKKNVIEKMVEKYSYENYQNDVAGYENEFTKGNFYGFFDTMIHPISKRYLSEDYAFCQKWIDIGGDMWLDLTCNLTHIGSFDFKGSVYSSIKDNIET